MRARLLTRGRKIGIIVYAVLLLIAAAIGLFFGHAPEDISFLQDSPPDETDRLAKELARCSTLGLGAEHDQDCKDAWAENRRRFFTYRALRAASESGVGQSANAPSQEK